MPSYAKKSPHSKRNGKKIKCNKFCAANKCRGKKTSMRRKKKNIEKKRETKNKYWGFRVLRSGAHWAKVGWCRMGRVVQVVGQQLIATNRCTKLQIAFPAWRGGHALPPVFTPPQTPRKVFDFPAAVLRLSGPPRPSPGEKQNTARFSFVEFYGSQIKFALQFASFWVGLSAFSRFSVLPFLWARNGNENAWAQPAGVLWMGQG